MKGLDRIRESAHPRLSTIIAGGVGLILGAVMLAVLGSVTDLVWTQYSLPLAILGYLLLLFGGSGYVAISLFERRPDS